MAPIDVPPDGWEVSITADQDGDLARGHLGILSSLSMPVPAAYAGTPTTRIVRSVVSGGRRTSTTTDVPQVTAERTGAGVTPGEPGARARLTYEDDQGPHEFTMQKDSLVVGRGGSAAWVDVQVVTTAKVSREHVAHTPGAVRSVRDSGRQPVGHVRERRALATGGQDR